ncbi:MAG: hypothetical protein Q4B50_00220 [Bacillota bacterium]|nr:hypothetical protein [Bacillota bacterium]
MTDQFNEDILLPLPLDQPSEAEPQGFFQYLESVSFSSATFPKGSSGNATKAFENAFIAAAKKRGASSPLQRGINLLPRKTSISGSSAMVSFIEETMIRPLRLPNWIREKHWFSPKPAFLRRKIR